MLTSLNKKQLQIAMILAAFLYTLPVSAEVFKCTTAEGETIYSSKKCMGSLEVLSLNKGNKPAVTIYITKWCPYCKKAMAYLRSKNISFTPYDIEQSAYAKLKKQKLAPGYTGVPLTVINGTILKGFSADRFDKALSL